MGFIKKLASGYPWGNYFNSRFCVQPTYNAYDHQTPPTRFEFTSWSGGASEIHFLCPEEFALGQCMIRTRNFSICSRTRYHWTNASHLLSSANLCSPLEDIEYFKHKIIDIDIKTIFRKYISNLHHSAS